MVEEMTAAMSDLMVEMKDVAKSEILDPGPSS